MRKKLFAIIVLLLTIFYSITGALLFLDIQLLRAPETTIEIDLVDLNTNEAVIQTTITVTNPNSFEVITKDFTVILFAETGNKISQMHLEGGTVPAQQSRTFTKTTSMSFNGENISSLTAKISSTLGANFLGFIKKTLPLNITIKTSLGNILDDIKPPTIHIDAAMKEITQEGVTVTGSFNVYNPNSFDLSITAMSVEIKGDTGETVGTMSIPDEVIPAKSSVIVNSSGMILLKALNSEVLTVSLDGTAGVKLAGVNKSLSFAVDAKIDIPSLEDIFSSNTPTMAVIKADMKATLRGFISYMTLELNNPNKLALSARNVTFTVYRVDNEIQQFIGSCVIEKAEVPGASSTNISAEVPLPYRKLFLVRGKGLIPDALLVEVRANVTLSGLDKYVWIGVSGYQDIRIFR